jgi:TonB family protein
MQGLSKRDPGEGMSLHKMIFFSCLAHVVALIILIIAPSVPSPRWTFGPIYSVQLVSMSEDLLEKRAPASSLSREFLEKDSAKQAVVVKKNTDALDSAPIKRIDVQKTQERESIVDKALENLRKSGAPAQPAEETRTASPAAKGETAQGAPSGTADRAIQRYYGEIWSRIKGQWVFPQAISPKENFSAVINVTISRSGVITDLHFERRSGNRYFDDSSVRAIRKASPFPPLPGEIGDRNIDLGIRFHSKELR